MLETSRVTKELKSRLILNGYNYVDKDMKIEILKNCLAENISKDLDLKNAEKFDFVDMVDFLDSKLDDKLDNEKMFCSYINSVLNIVSEMQGSVISWEQTIYSTSSKNVVLEYDEYGFISKAITSTTTKPSEVLKSFISEIDTNKDRKLLVK